MKVYFLIQHIDANAQDLIKSLPQTDDIMFDNKIDALNAADRYNENLKMLGISPTQCSYSVGSFQPKL